MRSDQGPAEATDTTERLAALIASEPGVTKSELRRRTGLAWGTICHHTERLVESGRVAVLEGAKHQHLFEAPVSRRVMERQVALRRPHAKDILGLFEQCREVDIPRAMDRTGLSRRVVSTRLTELEEVGLLERRGMGRPRFARPEAAGFRGCRGIDAAMSTVRPRWCTPESRGRSFQSLDNKAYIP